MLRVNQASIFSLKASVTPFCQKLITRSPNQSLVDLEMTPGMDKKWCAVKNEVLIVLTKLNMFNDPVQNAFKTVMQ